MSVDHERLLSDDYLSSLGARPLEQVRAMRDECAEVETGLSYQRRLVQGPLDLVRHELSRRAGGEGRADLATVLASLPEVLADGPRGSGTGRLSSALEPTVVDEAFAAELAELTGDGVTGRVDDLDDDELRALAERLADVERRISERRRRYHGQIDALQAEITRRYRDGEASVDALLHQD